MVVYDLRRQGGRPADLPVRRLRKIRSKNAKAHSAQAFGPALLRFVAIVTLAVLATSIVIILASVIFGTWFSNGLVANVHHDPSTQDLGRLIQSIISR